jgi:CDP-diacylglycerol--serine O-phosphatidyltransferase
MPYIVAVGLLMVSRVPTFSGKTLGARVGRDWVVPILGLLVFFVAVLLTYPWETLTALALAYLAMIPVSIRSYRQQKSASEARQAES